MGESKILDPKDRRIINELQADGRIGLVELSKNVGLSHPSTGVRLQKLLSEDLVRITAMVNLKQLDIHIAVLVIEVDGLDQAMELCKNFSDCPRVFLAMPMSGDYNVAMVLVGEDFASLQIFIEKGVRPQPGVRRFSASFSSTPFKPAFLPISLPVELSNIAPCGEKCTDCDAFTSKVCTGCPAVEGYRGKM